MWFEKICGRPSYLHAIDSVFSFAARHRDFSDLNSSASLESVLVCSDNTAMLAGEEICYDVAEYLKALLSDLRETGICKFVAIQ
jgi:hypothetical protein